ncbi:MAG: acyl carrier protein [Symploca sp. SIO3C6]|uniref:Acyl carrier protein n=1 Tax=Symploca sp. SIO1C4 TaxID=2607765 RepID=A0A6B3NT74_9CYAN|nr:acyl carrier protein [Symploca sp. SIO3C6]NER32408.1 acyl carrier protein [Symploca sp. SIO1C4]NET06422.1 acyl carrier protein [Symploca sp. SIO2B6]
MSPLTMDPNLGNSLTAEAIQDWLVANIAEQLGVTTDEIDLQAHLDSLGLDSAQGMIIASKGENFLGFTISPLLLLHYPTIETLSERLAEEIAGSESEFLEI